MTANYKNLIGEIARLSHLAGAPDLVSPVLQLLDEERKTIHIALLGQFKSGKSSLINSIIGESILPVGVVPVTAIVTRLQYGSEPKLTIRFSDKTEVSASFTDLPLYVTEKLNPGNHRNVSLAIVEHPLLEPVRNVSLVDTPGLNSFYRHNSETTLQWLPFTGAAMISISAERPLSEEDINLIKGTFLHCPHLALVITKTDLFTPAQIEEIKAHIAVSVSKIIPGEIPIFEYSVFNGLEHHRRTLTDHFISRFNRDFEKEYDEIIRYKIRYAIRQSIRYTELALQAAMKREKEKDAIILVLKEIAANRHHHEREMLLSATAFKGETRDKLETLIFPFMTELSQKLVKQFAGDYYTWKGSLFGVSRCFEQWLKENLGREIAGMEKQCFRQINQIVKEAAGYYEYSSLQYRQRLNDRIQQMFGVALPDISWQIEFSGIDKPDVSVYRAFDSHLDTLLFFLPMKWFNRLFYRHFEKQIPGEAEKNLYRYISGITEKIIKSIDAIHRQALLFIINENKDVERILLNDSGNRIELQSVIHRLKELEITTSEVTDH
ncbi:MAG: dynamin family protein [Bacteroidales bacterium]|nr:dynamin family protein [Bacteroidales bacterium]